MCRQVRLLVLSLAAICLSASLAAAQQQSESTSPVAPAAKPANVPRTGTEWRDPVTGMEFVWVPGGSFEMGCGSWTSDCDSDEKPVHSVRLSGFWLAKYEVTQGQWQRVMGNNPSHFKKGDNYPVERVSWNDAKEFISRLNAQGSARFRLPSEAEWEYAARSGGKAEKYAGGNDIDRVAWYFGNSGQSTHPVGTKAPNDLGLYDMTGNVWEYVEDVKANYTSSSQDNPVITGGGSTRVGRGGSSLNRPTSMRASSRGDRPPHGMYIDAGFRLALSVQPGFAGVEQIIQPITAIRSLKIVKDLTGNNVTQLTQISGEESAEPGTVHLISGKYIIVPKRYNAKIGEYKGQYYLLPATAKFSGLFYGHFCGPGWGVGDNDSKPPVADVGIDAACKEHDTDWSKGKYADGDKRLQKALMAIKGQPTAPDEAKSPFGWQVQAFKAIRNDLKRLQQALGVRAKDKPISPDQAMSPYESAYLSAALDWISCRVDNKYTTAWPGKCGAGALVDMVISEVFR